MENITVQFYEGKKVGLYEFGAESDDPAIAVGHTEIWNQLYDWIQEIRDFSNTSTYGKYEKNCSYRTFCFHIDKINNQNEFLITTWNEIPNFESGIAYVDANARVGEDIEVNSTQLNEDAIPGYPSYFWAIPEKNSIASIKVQGSYNLIGTQNLHFYMKSFLEKFSDPVNAKQDDETGDVHAFYEVDGEERACTAKFDLVLKREKANIEDLVSKFGLVRKVIKKATITTEMSKEQMPNYFIRGVKRVSEMLGGEGFLPENDVTNWHFDFKYTPKSEKEFQRVIDRYIEEANENEDIDTNLGVEFEGKSKKPVWMNDNVLKVANIPCKPEYMSNKQFILDHEWLKGFILRQRDMLLRKIK